MTFSLSPWCSQRASLALATAIPRFSCCSSRAMETWLPRAISEATGATVPGRAEPTTYVWTYPWRATPS